jgi:hypothetical protein
MENLSFETAQPVHNNEKSEQQKKREKRYINAVEKKYQTLETVDIFETPLLFRSDRSIFAFLEFDRRGGITTHAETMATYEKIPEKNPEYKIIYTEAPLPWGRGPWNVSLSEDDRRKMRGLIKKRDKIVGFETPGMVTRGENSHEYYANRIKRTMQFKKESQAVISTWLNDPVLTKVWLEIQNEWIHTGEKGTARNCFLIKPQNIKKLAFSGDQRHGDYNCEIVHLGKIDRNEIAGFLYNKYDRQWKNGSALKALEDDLKRRVDKKETISELFPNSQKSLLDNVLAYIKKHFDFEVKEDTLERDLILAILKKMGIPIYDEGGNQLWPERKWHEQIVEELAGKHKNKAEGK